MAKRGRPPKPRVMIPVDRGVRYDDKWDQLLYGLTLGMSVSSACRHAKLDTSDAYKRRREDELFAAQWAACVDDGTDLLEDEAWLRATTGKSDYLLMMLLKARRPNVYGERLHVDVKHTIAWEPLSEAEWIAQYGGGAMIEHDDEEATGSPHVRKSTPPVGG